LSYSEAHEQAEWVAYPLLKEQLSKNDFERPYFVADRKVKSGSADWRNYKNSGYDRGHLCPAGDRRYDYNAYHETFLTSNVSPQNREFNSGVWNYLEQKVRYWAQAKDGVYVITGGVLGDQLASIGDEDVSVPEEFYKIVMDASDGTPRAIAFLIPNEPTSKSFFDFTVSVDEIESKTGIDFFPNLSPSEEKQLESKVNLKTWGKR
jgi:endonuclease G